MTENDRLLLEQARLAFKEMMVMKCHMHRIAVELGMPSERYWELSNEAEVAFSQYSLEKRESKGDL